MFYYLLMPLIPMISACQSISQKQYTLKNKSPNVILFSAITSLIAFFFFLITSGFDLNFDIRLVPYALGFAVCYASAWVGTVMALRYGLMALSSLIVSFSLVFPTVYGIIHGEAVTPLVIIGLTLLGAAIVLINLKSGQKGRFSVKWLLCVAVAFVGNGFCSIMQNMQKRTLGDSYTHEFMLIALSAAFVLLMGYALLTSRNIVADLKGCLPYSTMNGVANALVNFLTLTLIGRIPNTVLYPTNSALGMLVTFLLAFFGYKERFTKMQYIGYVLGAASIVLLNLR